MIIPLLDTPFFKPSQWDTTLPESKMLLFLVLLVLARLATSSSALNDGHASARVLTAPASLEARDSSYIFCDNKSICKSSLPWPRAAVELTYITQSTATLHKHASPASVATLAAAQTAPARLESVFRTLLATARAATTRQEGVRLVCRTIRSVPLSQTSLLLSTLPTALPRSCSRR